MKRRAFIAMMGGAAAYPFAARAQTPLPFVAFFNGQTAAEVKSYVEAFRAGLKEGGSLEGQNVTVEYLYAENRRDKLPAMAADFVRRGAAVIVTTGGTPVTVAAKAATSTIPVVFAMGGDPVELGVVASLNRPGGNATGSAYFFNVLGAKRLALLHELVPTAKVIGYLLNPTNPSLVSESKNIQDAARQLGIEIRIARASNERDIDAAFAAFDRPRVDAVVLAADVFFTARREQITALAARYALPASYHTREIVRTGGLFCYGPNQAEAYRQAGIYTARILKGEKPADLPVILATKFELIINLKAATALGLTVPPTLLATADEVIK